MSLRGKSINLFLMDGTATGRMKCTLSNWTGVAYKIPRTDLDKCKEREDLSQSGVYFLFGTSEQTGENIAYIGQAGVRKNGEGILHRLQEHKRNQEKDYWTEAVVFTTSNNSFGPTEISYLENRFCSLATVARRYIVKNSNEPMIGNVTEEKESELEEFIDYAKIVMGTLGHKVFELLVYEASAEAEQVGIDGKSDNDPLFIYERKTGIAKGRRTREGFVVLKGSVLSAKLQHSCPANARLLREKYADGIRSDGVLETDLLFSSPSTAASFVVGSSANGNIMWKTAEGITLKEIENADIDTKGRCP